MNSFEDIFRKKFVQFEDWNLRPISPLRGFFSPGVGAVHVYVSMVERNIINLYNGIYVAFHTNKKVNTYQWSIFSEVYSLGIESDLC